MTGLESPDLRQAGRIVSSPLSYQQLYGQSFGLDFKLQGALPIDPPSFPCLHFWRNQNLVEEIGIDHLGSQDFVYLPQKEGHVFLVWNGQIAFRVDGLSREVQYQLISPQAQRDLENFYIHHVISYCLLLREIESIHSTVVVKGNKAVALLGDSGFGKSTTAAALVGIGFEILTDDLLVVREDAGKYFAMPGLARLKLLSDTIEAFELQFNFVGASGDKKIFELNSQLWPKEGIEICAFVALVPPIRREFVSRVELLPLSTHELFIRLIENTYNLMLNSKSRLVNQVHQFSPLARGVPGFELKVPEGLQHVGVGAELLNRILYA